MPARSRFMIRRGINRLHQFIQEKANEYPQLAAIAGIVSALVEKVNQAWQNFQQASLMGDKERAERDSAIAVLSKWVQSWRSVVMIAVPGASANIHNLPPNGGTADDIIRIAEDMQQLLAENPAAENFKDNALAELTPILESAKKENAEAVQALPAENTTREVYTQACLEANEVLVKGSEIVRSIFGRTSPEYKQFITRSGSSDDDHDEEIEAELGPEE